MAQERELFALKRRERTERNELDTQYRVCPWCIVVSVRTVTTGLLC